MAFIIFFIFQQTGKIFSRSFVVTHLIVKSAKCKVVKWRRIRHHFENPLTILNYFSDLKPIPTPIWVAENCICRHIELEDLLDLPFSRAPPDKPNDKRNSRYE